MFDLMQENYIGVNFETFREDLYAKSEIFLFFGEGKIQGFTGLQFLKLNVENSELLIAYSGDTVLDKTYRGSLSIPVNWGRYMLGLSKSHSKLYWLLTSKGFRTYRYLSVFFKEFIPMPEPSNYSLTMLRENIAIHLFGSSYDSRKGILVRDNNVQTIKDIEIDKNAIKSSNDPFINFFEQSNPNFELGHELVCLAHFHSSNISPYILRILESTKNV